MNGYKSTFNFSTFYFHASPPYTKEGPKPANMPAKNHIRKSFMVWLLGAMSHLLINSVNSKH